MKKICILLNLLFCSLSLMSYAYGHPEANFGIYGIQRCNTLSEYQKYIGETVVYLPKETPSYEDIHEFNGEFNKEYIIAQITGDDKLMIFTLQEKEGKKKIKMIINNQDELYSLGKNTYCITESYSVPLFLIEKFNQDKSKYIGIKYTSDKVITEYECVDVVMKTKKPKYSFQDMPYPTLHYILKNSITGEEKAYPAEDAENECFAEDISGKYVSTLVEVEKPVDESVRYGETKLVEIEGVTKFRYIDDFIDILIFNGFSQFDFLLKNISQHTLKLVWNEAVFVDFSGQTSKVMHVGTKYAEREEDQPASIIIKGASIGDVAIPICNVRYSETIKKWMTDSMYPETPAISPGLLKLMLPIQVKDVTNEYVFVFKVDWIYNHPELLKK